LRGSQHLRLPRRMVMDSMETLSFAHSTGNHPIRSIPYRPQNHPTRSPLDQARNYLRRGWQIIPVPAGQKQPMLKGWQDLRLTEDDLEAHFSEGPINFGVLLGEPSGGLIDIDLDAPEAVQLAPYFLPSTDCIFGRASKPRSHWLYRTDPVVRTKKFQFADPSSKKTSMLVEVRSTGCQTVIPPSIHPEEEIIQFDRDGEPVNISGETLVRAVGRLAAASLLVRYWPEGSRHDAALALAGGLLRSGWSEDDVTSFIQAVATEAGDPEVTDRVRAVGDTAAKLRRNEPCTGWPRLAELLGTDVVSQVQRWLGVASDSPADVPDTDLTTVQHHEALIAPDGRTRDAPYQVRDGRIGMVIMDKSGNENWLPLCNFVARVTAEIVYDDGDGASYRYFEVAGELADGTKLETLYVSAAEFSSMDWVTPRWGVRAIIAAGHGNADHLREAIQWLSAGFDVRRVFRHIGWQKWPEGWVYLHAGGGIGPEEAVSSVSVELHDPVSRFLLPPPPDDATLRERVRASLDLLGVAPDRITIPLLAAVYRAPLGDPNLTLFLTGPTGTGKTSLATLCQQHYGAGMNGNRLPAGWSSTANALEGLAFLVKDAVLVIDDYVPHGTSLDVARLGDKADRLIRGVANGQGRQRMRADGSLQPNRPPRSLIIGTGEGVPPGQSLRARMLVLELQRSDVNWDHLWACQQHAAAGGYAEVMAAYIRWLSPRMETIRSHLPEEIQAIREGLVAPHRRTADMIAEVAVGWKYFLEFAESVEAIDADQRSALWQRAIRAFFRVAEAQLEHQQEEDPVSRFFDLLRNAIATGRASIRDLSGSGNGRWESFNVSSPCIGWVEKDNLYLDPDTAYTVAQEMALRMDRAGSGVQMGKRSLWKRLNERGLLKSTEQGSRGTLTVRHRIENERRSVLHLPISVLEDDGDRVEASNAVPVGTR
jgi:hypothetical protein